MAGTGSPGLFAFTNRPMPGEPGGGYQTVGVLLRVLGWIVLAYGALVVLGVLFVALTAMFLGAVFESTVGRWGWLDGLGASIAIIVFVVMLFVAVVVVGITIGLLLWISTAYERWRTQHPSGPGHVLVLGIVGTALGALSVLGGLASRGPMDSVGGLVALGFGVAFLVLQGRPEVRAAFAGPDGRPRPTDLPEG